MKYFVTRSSDIFRENKPCEEAVLVDKDEEWDNIWAVEIDSIEGLMAFIAKYGKVVVGSNWIEIYDGYRE